MDRKDLKWGYITPGGEEAITPVFDAAADFHEGLAAVKVDWARGYIDRSGRWVIEPAFEAADDFIDGRAIVSLDGATRLIDRQGRVIGDAAPPSAPAPTVGYDPHYELRDGLMRFVDNQKFGYKDKDGNIIIKPQYVDAGDFSEGLAFVRRGKSSLWGYIDTTGATVIAPRFRQARPFSEGLAAVLLPIP